MKLIRLSLCIFAFCIFIIGFQTAMSQDTISKPTIVATKLDNERLRLKYTVTWGLFVVFESEFIMEVKDGRYFVSSNGRTKGVASLFNGGRSNVWAEGLLTENGVTPRLYQNAGKFEGKKFRRTVFFDEMGRKMEIDRDWPKKWAEKYKREPVPLAMQIGPDPISLLTFMIREQNQLDTAFEEGAVPIRLRSYDGSKVADFILECKPGVEDLSKNRKSIFEGPASVCYAEDELIAGATIVTEEIEKEREKQRKKAEKRKARADKDDEKAGEKPDDDRLKLWFADYDNSGLVIPVRAAVASNIGTVRIFLREFERLPLEGQVGRPETLASLCEGNVPQSRQDQCEGDFKALAD